MENNYQLLIFPGDQPEQQRPTEADSWCGRGHSADWREREGQLSRRLLPRPQVPVRHGGVLPHRHGGAVAAVQPGQHAGPRQVEALLDAQHIGDLDVGQREHSVMIWLGNNFQRRKIFWSNKVLCQIISENISDLLNPLNVISIVSVENEISMLNCTMLFISSNSYTVPAHFFK